MNLNYCKQNIKFSEFTRRKYKKKQAPVKWKGYDDDFNNWIPIKDLINIKKDSI